MGVRRWVFDREKGYLDSSQSGPLVLYEDYAHKETECEALALERDRWMRSHSEACKERDQLTGKLERITAQLEQLLAREEEFALLNKIVPVAAQHGGHDPKLERLLRQLDMLRSKGI